MRIQHNIMAMNAYRNYNNNTSALSKNLEKLSSGYKINRAGDDAAGLAISEKMRAQITGLNAAQKNVKDGISLVKTAEGAMQEIQDMLNRMDYLATQSANGTYDDPVDRANLQKEVNALRTEIDRIAESANFNGIKLLNGQQSLKAGEASTVAIDVTASAPTAGVAKSGGAKDIPDANFAPSGNINSGLHPGTPSSPAAAPSFSINLKDLKIDGVTNDAAGTEITVTIGGGAFKATVSVGNAGDAYTGASLAEALDGATANIGGVEFTATAGTDGRVTFTATTAADALGKADAINTQIKGTEVEVGGTGLTPYGNWVHGLQDITLAADEVKGKLAGVSFKLDANIVQDGNRLTIGDKNYVFVIGDNSAAVTKTGDIEITLNSATDFAEAARQMADSTKSIGDPDNTDEVFKISSITADGTIHIDQQNKAASTPKTYTTAELTGLFSLEELTRNETKASIELSAAAADSGVADGDRVLYNGKSYIIGTAPADADAETAKSYMSAASFNEMLATDAANSLKAAADEVLAGGSYAGKYEATLADGKVKIEALKGDNLDTADVMNAIKSAVDAKVADMKITKLDQENVGKGGLNLQIGDTSEPFNQMAVQIGDMHTKAMGTMETVLDGGLQTAKTGESIADIDISTAENASKAIDVIKNAINYVSGIRGDLGAIQNRLEHTQNNLSVMAENIQDAESTIRDTDVANEMMSYVKNNILVQSAQAMLAQANQVPQGVLQLLG